MGHHSASLPPPLFERGPEGNVFTGAGQENVGEFLHAPRIKRRFGYRSQFVFAGGHWLVGSGSVNGGLSAKGTAYKRAQVSPRLSAGFFPGSSRHCT
jgi:hypothetical protein